MDRLKHALVELGIASLEELDEAVARQQLYGADLLTNLLEVRSFTEGQALRALEHAYGLPALSPGPLPRASPAVVSCSGLSVGAFRTSVTGRHKQPHVG